MPPLPQSSDAGRFLSTHWSQVLRAASPDAAGAKPALAELCRAYWYPLYAYHRRRGAEANAAEDAVQSFFAWFLDSGALSYADPGRGRFRGFLVAAFQQFLARRHEFDNAAKRKPSAPVVSLHGADDHYAHEPADHATPERLYEQTWALAVLQRATERLRIEMATQGQADRHHAFQGMMTGQETKSAREVGTTLGMTEGAVRVAVHRMRHRYAAILREEVAATLDVGEDVDAELRHLIAALRPGGV